MSLRAFYKRLQAIVKFRGLTFEKLRTRPEIYLYAGDLPGMKEYRKFVGLSLTQCNKWHIRHDVTRPYPLPANCVDVFQSEDVFEHIPLEELPAIINEIHRILKVGGVFRLGVPDYRCDILYNRSIKNTAGEIQFDPRGGGKFVNGKVTERGHVWFPKYETVKDLLSRTRFRNVFFYHYYNERGEAITHKIDYSLGHVKRTPDHDERVKNPYRPLSIVVDCVKEAEA